MTIRGSLLLSVPIVKRFFGSAHAQYHVTCNYGVCGNHIFRIPDPTFPIHYSTFSGLRWRLLLSVPVFKPFSAENFLPKSVPKMAVYRKNGGLNIIFYFQNPKRHILAWDRVFWRILREDQFWGLGCSLAEEPKNDVIFHAYGEKKPLVGSAQNFALGKYPERNHRWKFGGRSVEPFLRGEGSNFRLFHTLSQSSL